MPTSSGVTNVGNVQYLQNNYKSNFLIIPISRRKGLVYKIKKKCVDKTNDNFLTIEPVLTVNERKKLYKRSNSTLTTVTTKTINSSSNDPIAVRTYDDGTVHIFHTNSEKDSLPDRISLDRRGLKLFPIIDGEIKLRLLSLQHNLIDNLTSLKQQKFPYLVFLDIYDNQLDQLCCLETLENLRVLLVGKNRIRKIDGLVTLKKIEVLDLHGNQITQITGLSNLNELKVLNLAGNQIRYIGTTDFQGLTSLQELNLRRNCLRKLLGFHETPNLIKVFISNNDLQNIEDMCSLVKLINLKEICIDNNPVFSNSDCTSFLVSYLPNLIKLNTLLITEQLRKSGIAWRRNKELTNTAFMDLTSDVCLNVRREEIISNARTNWELLRSQTRCVTTTKAAIKSSITTNFNNTLRNLSVDNDLILTKFTNSRKLPIKSNTNSILKVPLLRQKKLIKTNSQDTDISQNTAITSTTITTSSSSTNSEFIRLPPILVPIIKKMVQKNDDIKLSSSLSSIGPNIDSSVSSLDTDNESSSSSDNNDNNCEDLNDIETSDKIEKIITETPSKDDVKDNQSNITLPSTSSSDLSTSSKRNCRNIKSAINTRAVPVKNQQKIRAVTAKTNRKQTTPLSSKGKDREQGGDYLIEICGRYLNVYGQCALRFIDKSWNTAKANDVNTVKFTYINFNNIVAILNRIKLRFPNLEHFIFKETNIYCLGQLNGLAEIQGFTSLSIENDGNPIIGKNWKSYAIYRLSHWGLTVINDHQVKEEEITSANQEYQSLSDLVLLSLPDELLQPLLLRLRLDIGISMEHNAKKWLSTADPELRSVVCKEALQWKKPSLQDDIVMKQRAKQHLSQLLDELANSIRKLRELDVKWPAILHEFVQNTLLDYSQLDIYMKRKMLELLK